MSLFFDAAWFDAKLAAKGIGRSALAEAAGLEIGELTHLLNNERAPTAAELAAFAALLGADLVEVTLKGGVALRETPTGADASARIEHIEARLDAMDAWLAEFEAQARRRA